jgi:hypothetical protein
MQQFVCRLVVIFVFFNSYIMKKVIWFLVSIVVILSACNSDDEDVTQISFSFPNMTTLLDKSGKYVKQASPGTFYQYTEYTDYSFYTYIFDEITVLGTLYINYYLQDDACGQITMFTQSDELAKAQELMLIANEELGEANIYILDYFIDSVTYDEVTFTTYASLWSYITDHSYTREDIYQLYSYYIYDDHETYAGGYWDQGEFWPVAQIQYPSVKSTAATPKFRSFKGIARERVLPAGGD